MSIKKSNLVNYIEQSYKSANHKNIKKLIRIKPNNIIVEALEQIEDIEILKYFLANCISPKNNKIGEIFDSLNHQLKIDIIEKSNSKLIYQIFEDLEINESFNFLEEIPKELKKRIFISISPSIRKEIIKLSKFNEDEVGQIMNPFFLHQKPNTTIADATQYISDNREEITLNDILYVVNDDNQLLGSIHIHDILLEKQKNKILESIIQQDEIKVYTSDEIEEIILIFQKFDVHSVAVLNEKEQIVGSISDNEIISVISDETTDDIYKMYGITELNQPYTSTSIMMIVKSRIFWLILLMLFSTISSALIDFFTQKGEMLTLGLSTVFLIPIIPVISGTSGNAGSQSAATMIRSLSIGEISKKDYSRVIRKEFFVALVIAAILALINYFRLVAYFGIRCAVLNFPIKINDSQIDLPSHFMEVASLASIGVSLSLFIAILISKIIGSLLPILAIRMNIDPASMASPLLTTMIDSITTSILFGIGFGFLIISKDCLHPFH
ncbi:MAG: magnesium transporter [Mycoplasmoidaceae bacterium]